MHKHHIVFKSQGGLDFALNYKYLTTEEHEGNNGPHRNRKVDLAYKTELQKNLEQLFSGEKLYTEEDVAQKLGRSLAYWRKNLRKVDRTAGMMRGESIVKFLMGGRFY